METGRLSVDETRGSEINTPARSTCLHLEEGTSSSGVDIRVYSTTDGRIEIALHQQRSSCWFPPPPRHIGTPAIHLLLLYTEEKQLVRLLNDYMLQ